METDPYNGVSRVPHHPEFYLRDGNITFIVCYDVLSASCVR
jgi:hypothetical protein